MALTLVFGFCSIWLIIVDCSPLNGSDPQQRTMLHNRGVVQSHSLKNQSLEEIKKVLTYIPSCSDEDTECVLCHFIYNFLRCDGSRRLEKHSQNDTQKMNTLVITVQVSSQKLLLTLNMTSLLDYYVHKLFIKPPSESSPSTPVCFVFPSKHTVPLRELHIPAHFQGCSSCNWESFYSFLNHSIQLQVLNIAKAAILDNLQFFHILSVLKDKPLVALTLSVSNGYFGNLLYLKPMRVLYWMETACSNIGNFKIQSQYGSEVSQRNEYCLAFCNTEKILDWLDFSDSFNENNKDIIYASV